MHLFTKPAAPTVSRPRSWRAGLTSLAALLLLAAPSVAATYTLDVSVSPQPTYGTVIGSNITFGGVAISNGINVVNDPIGAGVEILVTGSNAVSTIFSHWSGTLASSLVNSNAQTTVLSLEADGTLVANFDLRSALTVTPSPSGAGTTIPNGTTNVPRNRPFAIKATPNANYEFMRWTNVLGSPVVTDSSSPETTVIPNGNVAAVSAIFQTMPRLTVTAPSDGGISVNGVPVPAGTSQTFPFPTNSVVDLVAMPGADKDFLSWFPATGVVTDPSNSTTTVTMNRNKTLTVQFQNKIVKQTLITLAGANGTVSPAGTNLYVKDSFIDITASPNPGYIFLKWVLPPLDGPVNPAIAFQNPLVNIQMNQDRAFKALFTNRYTVRVGQAGGPGTASNFFAVAAGTPWSNTPPTTVVGLSTIRDILTGWDQGTGDVTPVSGSATVVSVPSATQDSTFRWTWQKQYLLITSAVGSGTVTPATGTDGAWYNAGATVTVSAVAETGFLLESWRINGVKQVQANDNFDLVMNEPKTVEALFIAAGDRYLPLWWRRMFGLDSSTTDPNDGPDGDPDNDGLSNWQEYSMMVTNVQNSPPLYMNPINADTDGDGLDDGYEFRVFDLPRMTDPDAMGGNAAFISAAMRVDAPYGRNHNPDGDYLWSTNNGYAMTNQVLSNIMEYIGPDAQGPQIVSTVWSNVFPAGSPVSWRRDVLVLTANPSDTGDQSDPFDPDTDNDGLDDGYEYSWDQWQRDNWGRNIQLVVNWVPITGTVPEWIAADPSSRPYHPNRYRVVDASTLAPDYDWTYSRTLGTALSAWGDLSEYRASVVGSDTNGYFVTRAVRMPNPDTPWCTNPFLWDTDGDGLSDGWEVTFGYDPWARDTDGNGYSDGAENPDGDAYARDGALIHDEVYLANGFNPGVAWLPNYQTRANFYSNILEFIGGAAIGVGDLSNAVPAWMLGTEPARSTNPRNIDSDRDGMHDGWEMYIGFDPTYGADAGQNPDQPLDTLVNWQEFLGYGVMQHWRNMIAAGATPDVVQPAWSNFVSSWPNKGQPTDPFNPDTDNDQLYDSVEQAHFNYQTNGLPGAGGGLCPTSVDTDLDYLADNWERYWEGYLGTGTNGLPAWIGLDGTRNDALEDTDGDGLYNYQEYMVGACYQFQWMWNDGTFTWDDPAGSSYDPYDWFDVGLSGNSASTGPGALQPYAWDPAYWADRMVLFPYKPFTFMGGIMDIFDPTRAIFSTTDPNNVDSDFDGYDDFYELYHSLNPIRGISDMVTDKFYAELLEAITYSWPLTYDRPFRFGERPRGPVSDYDQDGQVDVEENLTANLPAVLTYSHTDPSPYFVGDVSSWESYINKFYKTGEVFGRRRFWYWDVPTLVDISYPTAYLFTFEMNEGYDTDNDVMADGVEIVGYSPGATDPLDDDSPLRQRALYLDGVDSAARVYSAGMHSWNSFRSFTVEAWVKPTAIDGDRVIVERAGMVTPGNPGLPGGTPRVTRNFRLGIKEGIPYIAYDGYGVNWAYEEASSGPQYKLTPNQWTHLTGVFDPAARLLRLYVNGELAVSKSTAQIPFNGFIAGDPTAGQVMLAFGMCVTVGASDLNPEGVCDGTLDAIKSGFYYWTMPPGNSFPILTDYFAGWVDEVRLWDGTRTADQIRDLRGMKLTRGLVNQINGVQTGNQSFQGDMGGSELNPKLLYAFTFDGVPDPADLKVPQGFDLAIQVPGWTAAPWWDLFPYKSSQYNDYRYVKWIQNMASHQPFDPPRDTRVVRMFNADGTTNIFPNSSNPYTFEYVHGLGGSWEVHPQYGPTQPTAFAGLGGVSQQRDYSGVYGDLLPLGAAKGDASTPMWDGSLPVDQTRDQDGDSLPDIWEEDNGLNPRDPLDAHDDPDRDGLSTRLEYMIGSNPFGAYSLTENIWDFFAYTNGVAGPFRFLGEEYTDMDYMDDYWEEAYGLNTEMYDAMGPDADPDNDGWSNLAEFQELVNLIASGGAGGLTGAQTNLFPAYTPLSSNAYYLSLLGDLSFLQVQDTNDTNAVTWTLQWNDPKDERFHPVPEMIFRFHYAGINRTMAAPRFVVLAYTDRAMMVPDASIRGLGDRNVGWPRYMALNRDNANSFSFEGDIREGDNWFWGFIDLNNDQVYQDNEPAGFAGPVNVRWGSVGPIDIPLTDKRPVGYGRFSWNNVQVTGTGTNRFDPDLVEAYHVWIVDRNVANAPTVYTNTFSPFRTWLHEGDLMAVKKLLKGFKRSGGYQWYVRAEYDNRLFDVATGMIYAKYAEPPPAPTLVWPVGNGRLRQSMDTFIWKMDPSVTRCTLTVRRRDTGLTVMSHTFTPPARDIYGKYRKQMPIYIGDGVFQNGVYDYTLTVMNPRGSASSTSQFTVRVGDYPGYSYSLTGSFIYPGKVTTGNFVVEAFTTPGFGGEPVGRRVIPNTITAAAWPTNVFSFTIRGLPADQYYVRAFLDQNNSYPNFKADDFESQGWYAWNFYWANAVEVSSSKTAELTDWIKVLMRDLDNDRLPDDWEYRWAGNLTTYGLGDLRGYTPSLNYPYLNVFECYGQQPLGVTP